MASKRVVEIPELIFPFRGAPYAQLPGVREECDPAPAYAHDAKLVRATLRDVEKTVPIKHRPTIYVLHHECIARTNGWANRDWHYGGDSEERSWNGVICLSGKRIPPHPAVTRYVVAHEYGHHVEWEIGRRRGANSHGDDQELLREYRELRGLDPERKEPYACGSWHSTVGELIANDFRILVAEIEPEYWPHPGFKRPERVAGLAKWWQEALA